MTDNNEPARSDATEKTTADGSAQESRQPSGGSGWRGLDAVVIALLIVALGMGGTSLYLNRQLLEQQLAAEESRTAQAEAVAELGAEQEELRAAVRRIDEAQQATNEALQEFADRERTDNLDWALAEVEYLAIIAMQRLNLARDPETALEALEAAQRRLRDLKNPALVPVREQLTRDINALRAVPETDAEGMALYLADLIERAEKLPLAADSATRPATAAEGEPAGQEAGGWRDVLQAIWQELRQLVVIQREDSPPTELLAPDERYFLHQNLRIELASARQAVLHRDTRNLRASIELIDDWLARYFNTDAEAVANIRESLARMATVDLEPALPEISGSLESIRAWQRRRAQSNEGGAP